MAKDPLKIAVGELGNTEFPANSNKVKYNTWYWGKEVSGKDYPWCMAFVQWCFDQAGLRLPHLTASCSDLLSWYWKYAPDRVIYGDPNPRDIIIYNFGHTGIVESDAFSTITAIEGNTSAGDAGSQSNGGGVFRRTRSKTLVTAYIRPFDNYEEDNMDINALIANMTDKQAYTLLEKAQKHAATLPAPDWAKTELQEAVAQGITDGSKPMQLIPRYQAAIMAKRG